MKAVTTCVIVATGIDYDPPLTAIDNALCADEDNFSRREGRARATHRKRWNGARPFEPFGPEIWVGFPPADIRPRRLSAWIQSSARRASCSFHSKTKRPKPRLSAEQIVERRLAR